MALVSHEKQFSDLIDLQAEEIKQTFTLHDLEIIISRYLEQNDLPKDEILTKSIDFIKEKIFTKFESDDGFVCFMDTIFGNLYRVFEIVIDSISRNQRTIEGSCILLFLHSLRDIFVQIETPDLDLLSLAVVVSNVLKFLRKYFLLAKDLDNQIEVQQSNGEQFNELLEETSNLHAKIRNVLINNMQLLVCQSDSHSKEIEKIIVELTNTAEILASLCILECTSTLKLILKISTNNSQYFEIEARDNYDWLSKIINFLCHQMYMLLLEFHKEENKNEENDETIKYLKISAFYIQYMNKITEHFNVSKISGYNCLIPVLFQIYRLAKCVSPEVMKLIQQHLTDNLFHLIRKVYINEDFIKEYITKSHELKEDFGFCVLGLEIMNWLSVNKDEYAFSIYFYADFFDKLFTKISKCPELFLLKKYYLKLQSSILSLFILQQDNLDVVTQFEDFLVNGLLQFDLLLSKICFDIWLFLASSIGSDKVFHYYEFWADVTQSFPINCRDPRIVQIDSLTKTLYESLPKSYQETILSQNNLDENSRILSVLGINNIPDSSIKLSFKNYAQGKLMKSLQILTEEKGLDREMYSNLINLFRLFYDCKITNRSIPSLVVDCLKIIKSKKNVQQHDYMLNILVEFIMHNQSFFAEQEILSVCSDLEMIVKESGNTSIQFSCYKLHKLLGTWSANSDALPKIIALSSFENHLNIKIAEFDLIKKLKTLKPTEISIWDCSSNAPDQIIHNNHSQTMEAKTKFQKKVCTPSTSHEDDSSTQELKRPKMYNTSLVPAALENAKQIANFFSSNKINQHDLSTIKEIIRIYNDVIKP